jgi:hypothetical protein
VIFWPKFPCPPLRQNTYSPFLFAICDYFNVRRPISFFFPLRQTPFDSRHFFPPHQLFKKGKKLREKKKTRQIFSFFFKFGNWSLCSSVIRPTTHTHTKTNNPTQFRKQKKEEVDFKRFLGFSSLGKTNHRVYTNKTKTGISKN